MQRLARTYALIALSLVLTSRYLAFPDSTFADAKPPDAKGKVVMERYFPDPSTGTCRAVSVTTEAGLVHTAQVLPVNEDGSVFAPGSARTQVRQAFGNLATVLAGAHSDLKHVAKLNIYVADASVTSEVHRYLGGVFDGEALPAVTIIATRLPVEGALIAVDAVAAAPGADTGLVQFGAASKFAPGSESAFAILPPGPRVYISGQAEKGDGSLADATGKTLASLVLSLKHCGLDRGQIVQLKAFTHPIADASIVEKAVAHFFEGGKVPPLILVEWKGGGVPIEIELIASSPRVKRETEPVEYLTPPELKKSPVYSRIARVDSPRVVYVSGLVAGKEDRSAADEVRALFPLLQETLKPAGGDLNHLVKATYYVADADVGGQLNKIRPEFYHPDRPPTASKAEISDTGMAGHRIVIDMIAVPK